MVVLAFLMAVAAAVAAKVVQGANECFIVPVNKIEDCHHVNQHIRQYIKIMDHLIIRIPYHVYNLNHVN